MDTNPLPSTETSHNQRSLAALSYVWVLSLPVLLSAKNDPFVGPHARQGALLFIFSVIAWFVPYVGYVIEIILGATMVMGYVRSSQGHAFILPLSTGSISHALTRLGQEWNQLWGKSVITEEKAAGELREETTAVGNTERENQMAACGYLSIASVIVADNDHGSAVVRFHARQGLVIFLLSIMFVQLGTIGTYANILLLIASVAGFLSALSGKATRLPLIHAISLRLPSLDTAWGIVKARIIGIRNTWRKNGGTVTEKDSPHEEPLTRPDEREKTLGMLAYFLLGPVFLLSTNASPFVTFHARQGLLLNAILIGLYAAFPTAYSGFAILLALTVLGASRSYKGMRSPLPVVAEVVDGIAKAFTLTKNHANIPHLSPDPEPSAGNTEGIHHG